MGDDWSPRAFHPGQTTIRRSDNTLPCILTTSLETAVSRLIILLPGFLSEGIRAENSLGVWLLNLGVAYLIVQYWVSIYVLLHNFYGTPRFQGALGTEV